MAIVKIVPDKLAELNKGKTMSAAKSIDASDGIYIDYTGKDHNILLILKGSAADTVTIEKGDGLQGVCDETVAVDGTNSVAITLESGRFKLMSGQHKGFVHLKGKATTTVQAVELPV